MIQLKFTAPGLSVEAHLPLDRLPDLLKLIHGSSLVSDDSRELVKSKIGIEAIWNVVNRRPCWGDIEHVALLAAAWVELEFASVWWNEDLLGKAFDAIGLSKDSFRPKCYSHPNSITLRGMECDRLLVESVVKGCYRLTPKAWEMVTMALTTPF